MSIVNEKSASVKSCAAMVVPRLYCDTEISGSLIILQYVQIRSLVLIPLFKAATCRHVDQTISSSTGDALRFEPLGSTSFRNGR